MPLLRGDEGARDTVGRGRGGGGGGGGGGRGGGGGGVGRLACVGTTRERAEGEEREGENNMCF